MYKVLTGKVLQIPEEEVLSSSYQMMDTEINSLLEVDIGDNLPVNIKVNIFYRLTTVMALVS